MQSDISQKISEEIQNGAGEIQNPGQAAPGLAESPAQNLKKGTSLFEIILSFLNEKPINKEYHKNISKKFYPVFEKTNDKIYNFIRNVKR